MRHPWQGGEAAPLSAIPPRLLEQRELPCAAPLKDPIRDGRVGLQAGNGRRQLSHELQRQAVATLPELEAEERQRRRAVKGPVGGQRLVRESAPEQFKACMHVAIGAHKGMAEGVLDGSGHVAEGYARPMMLVQE